MTAKPFIRRGRTAAVLLLAALLGGVCSACGGQPQPAPSSGPNRPLIGFSLATLKEDRWIRDRDIFTAKAKQAGFDVLVTNANNDSQMQDEQVRDMVGKKIDLLVIAPQDRDAAAQCVQEAKRAGIPVVAYDRLVRKGNVDAYISFDTIKVGEIQAQTLLQAAPEGGYLIVNGSKDDNNTSMTHQGFMDRLQGPIAQGQVQIVAETWVEDWRREGAYDFVYQQLKLHSGEISGIIAGNDSLAWGAIDALSEAKLARKVLVVGMDGDLAACQRIVDGTQLLTVYKPLEKLVEQTLGACKLLLQGKKVDSGRTISDGLYEVPYIVVDVVGVTKENIDDTIIKDGFQLREDVYRTPSSGS